MHVYLTFINEMAGMSSLQVVKLWTLKGWSGMQGQTVLVSSEMPF